MKGAQDALFRTQLQSDSSSPESFALVPADDWRGLRAGRSAGAGRQLELVHDDGRAQHGDPGDSLPDHALLLDASVAGPRPQAGCPQRAYGCGDRGGRRTWWLGGTPGERLRLPPGRFTEQ